MTNNFKCSAGFLSQELHAIRVSSPTASERLTIPTPDPILPKDGFVVLVTHPLLDFVKIDASTDSVESIVAKYTQYYGKDMSMIIWETPYPAYCKKRFSKKCSENEMFPESDLFSKNDLGNTYVDVLDTVCEEQVYTYRV